MHKLSVIIPSYNVLPYLKITLNSLAENTFNDFELIIIDDNSNKETKEFLKNISSSCTVIFNERQEYVTHNWNTGIKLSHGQYIAILNNDVLLPKNWDVPLINGLNNDIWVTSPYLTDPISNIPFTINERFPKINIAGSCFMLKRKTFDITGLFPEEMKIWFNDVWLSWVITKVYKKKCIYIPEVVVHHFKSKSCESMSEVRRERFVEIISQDKLAFQKIKASYESDKKKISTPTI